MKFSISILAFNNLALTRRCVNSVFHAGTNLDEAELILTDNGSTDGVAGYFESVARSHANVTVVHNRTNEGFIEPNRAALTRSRGEFFVMLNNDTVVPRGWLDELVKPFADPKCALSGPQGGCCSLRDNFDGYQGKQLEYLEGSCLMARAMVVKRHGLFAPYLSFCYGEDSDLSLRMRRLGYTLHRVPIRVWHKGQSTSRMVPGIRQYQQHNHTELIKRWGHYLKVRRMDFPILVRRMGAIGDVLLTTPIIRALKQDWPLCNISVNTMFPRLFDKNPNVTEAGEWPMAGWLGDYPGARMIDLDMAYENRPHMHIVDAYAEAAGLDEWDTKLEIATDGEPSPGHEGVMDVGKWCAIHPGPTTWKGKTWPRERWNELAQRLQGLGWKVATVGGRGTWPIVADASGIGSQSFQQLAGTLSKCKLFVGVDSFPMHCAQAVGVPTVGIFGASTPEFVMTESSPHIGVQADMAEVPCVGARHRVSGQTFVDCDGACMRAVSVEMVMEAIGRILA